jgi:hypothetical protein
MKDRIQKQHYLARVDEQAKNPDGAKSSEPSKSGHTAKTIALYGFMPLAIATGFGAALGQERSLITSRRPHQDCVMLEAARSSTSEAYAAYAHCVIDNSYFAFHALYTRHLRDFPNEQHDVEARFTVGTDGTVKSAEAVSSGTSDTEFLKHIAARIRVIKFLPSESGAQEIRHTFKFSQTER